MRKRPTAEDQLGRILQLLPAAAGEDGASLSELARMLGTDARQIVRDLEEVYTREFYHPAGSGHDPQILIEPDRVHVWTKGEFRRPPSLTPAEALALGLGLRILAAEADEERRSELLAFAKRLEAEISASPPEALLSGVGISTGPASANAVRTVLVEASRERRQCRIGYVKPGVTRPDERVVSPYVLVAAQGHWYVIAFCGRSQDVRVFRLDRVVSAELGPEGFEVPDGFDPGAYVSEGRVFRAEEETTATVRYSPAIARWIREKGPVEEDGDGGVRVRYRVADPLWIVRHVLQYGADAELLDPPELRTLVRQALGRVRGTAV
jgi:proteasome accessory factor C